MRFRSFLGAIGFLFLFVSATAAQTTYTWTPAVGSTDWTLATNWNPTRTVPATDDIIVIDGTVTAGPTITNIPTQTIGRLRVMNSVNSGTDSGATLNAGTPVTPATTITLTIQGGAETDFEIDATSRLVLSGSTALIVSLGTGATGSVSGFMVVQSGAHQLTAADASGVTFNDGSIFTTSTGFSGNAFGSGTSNSVVFASGSSYVHNAGSNPFAKTAPNSIVVFQSGSAVVWRGAGSSFSASGRTYANLTIENNVSITSSGNSNFQFQTLSVASGSQFTHNGGNTATVTITGDITSAGSGNITITAGSGGIAINSGSTQTFGSGGGTGSITFGSSATISSGTAVTLARSLTISSGTLTVNGTLTRSAGNGVIGNLNKPFSAAGSKDFEVGTANGFSPVTANVTSGTFPADFTLKATQTAQPDVLDSTRALQRFWTITASGVTADLTFHYLDADVPSTATESSFIIFEHDTVFRTPGGSVDAAANTASISGVTSFSDWTLAEPSAPTVVSLESFVAKGGPNGVLLEWQTGFETENLGFNVYRDFSGRRIRINPGLIAGSALLAGPATVLTAGSAYRWWDSSGDRTAQYWLENVDLDGKSVWHGPMNVEYSPDALVRGNALRQSLLVSSLGKNSQDSSQAETSRPAERRAPQARVSPLKAKTDRDPASQPAIKLQVKREGWYRLTQAELLAAGMDLRTDSRFLQLFAEGREIPIAVRGADTAQLDASGSVEFYGMGLDSTATDRRVYWLVTGPKQGLRIPTFKDRGLPSSLTSFPYTVERREKTIYFGSLLNGEKENFFGAAVSKDPVDQPLVVWHLDPVAANPAVLEVALQGVTKTHHQVTIQLNGTDAGELSFEGQAEGAAHFDLPKGLLSEGENRVTLQATAAGTDVSLVDFIRLTYRRLYAADKNELRFSLLAQEQATISGFDSAAITVLDVTNPDEVIEVSGEIRQQPSGWSVTVTAPSAGVRTLCAFTTQAVMHPAAVEANLPSNLRGKKRQVDLLIITRREFFESMRPLASLRESQGFKTEIIDVEDIFDEFSFGEKNPQAIKEFLLFAKTHWKRAPRFVLLVGDASFDPKNYLGNGDFDLLPTKLAETQFMETASDDWFADFDENGLPQMAIGRLPARTPVEADVMISKIIRHESSAGAGGVLLVNDKNDGFDFEAASSALRGFVPAPIPVSVVDRASTDAVAARSELLDGINKGQTIVSYSGHGSVNGWRGDLLRGTDVSSLRNERLPVFVTMTCLNGWFHSPAIESLAESLLKTEEAGAVAVWASSGLTDPAGQAAMEEEFFRLIFAQAASNPAPTLGEATTRAKTAAKDADVRRTWILFGDPSMRLLPMNTQNAGK